jgi:glycosyltransferase involved in cell wall biosynthesis
VSVILPTYNRARVLRPAVESVLGQTMGDLELIVVDDGSSDDTAAVLDRIDDARLRVVRLDGNRGASYARNRGAEAAAGALLAFIDSDDTWQPDKLARQVEALETAGPGVDMCVCSLVNRRGEQIIHVRYRDETLDGETATRRLASGAGMGTPCWLVRRETFAAAGGFDEALPRMQDYELALRIAGRSSLRLMSAVLVEARVGDDSLSASADRYADAIDAIAARHRGIFARHPSGHSHMIFRAGKYLALEGRCREAMPWFARAIRIHPGNIRALAGWVLCATGLFGLFRRLKYRRQTRD